ncbi:MAG: riboflavin synthase [Prevotellaceae bacterium]|jgi:riboflavin synthase|nr:riboflavin synthase [Prevotellaceae bacterium]
MFSGIIEEAGEVIAVKTELANKILTLSCSFAHELTVNQSLSHNGVCLTVTAVEGNTYSVTAIRETLDRSNLGLLSVGSKVNLERSMQLNGRLDGHIVQGHVDHTAVCQDIRNVEGSYVFKFQYNSSPDMRRRGYLTVDKGSITVNGVSLTVCNPTDYSFSVAIIPYTFEHTNFHQIEVGSVVNLEFDIIGKYIARMIP